MRLQTKAVLAFNAVIIFVCIAMGVLGYISSKKRLGSCLAKKCAFKYTVNH